MDTKTYLDLLNELDDFGQTDDFLNKTQRRTKYPPRNPKKTTKETLEFVGKQDDSSKNFKFTYKAARFEEWWLLESLGAFYEHRWISDVLGRIKGGKEASVYLCSAGAQVDAPYLPATVYRPTQLRNLTNDTQYRAGPTALD